MAKTALDLTPQELQHFRPLAAIRERQHSTDQETSLRQQQAILIAKKAAILLRQEFGASRVVLFGSAVRDRSFTNWSDIDLAVWGIASDRFFTAVATVTSLDADFQIDLVDVESCSSTLRKVIERDGMEL